jgi:short-subunit dehydrogenase
MISPGTACITGASSGIGEAFARRLASAGYSLLLHGRREELLTALCDNFRRQFGIRAEYLLAELSHPDELRAFEDRLKRTPDLSMLVNNAGYATIRQFSEEEIDGQEALIHTHVTATVRLTHAALSGMLVRGAGTIVNVSSVAGFLNSPGSVTYCATKAYLISFTESLHLEVGGRGLRLQALCPRFTRSDFHSRLGYDTSGDFFKRFMSAEEVVDISLHDLRRGKIVSIPGLQYKVAAFLPHLLPRRLYYWIVLKRQGYKTKKPGRTAGQPR